MTHRSGFVGNAVRAQQKHRARAMALAFFMSLMTLAIGVPLISKPRVMIPQLNTVAPVVPTPQPKTDVYSAVKAIPPGIKLQLSMFEVKRINSSAIATIGRDIVRSSQDLVGKTSKYPIMPGTPVFLDQVGEDSANALIRKIKPGHRAVTIKVDDVTGIEGWSAPGARVDVLWITKLKNDPLVSLIVKDIQVLSVMGRTETQSDVPNQAVTPPPNSAPKAVGNTSLPPQFTVSLLVKPEEGQKIMLALSSGRISLMLRGEFDTSPDGHYNTSISASELLERDRPAVAQQQGQRMQGSARVKRNNGSYDEWSVIDGHVMKWEQALSSQ